MEATAWVLFTLGISLILAKIGDSLLERFELPGVLGELLMGIILGNLVYFGVVSSKYLPIIAGSSEVIDFMAKLGVVFLLFLGALDTDLTLIRRTGVTAVTSTILGVFVPLILGYLGLRWLGYDNKEAFAGGVLLTATSIGLTVRVMMDLGVLRSEVGAASLSASVIDDFLGIALIIFAVGSDSLLKLGIKIIVFFLITGVIGWYFIDHYLKFAEKLGVEKGVLGLILGMMLLFSALAEEWFTAAIEGAFMMGLILSKTAEGKRLLEEVRSIGYGLLIPIFFVHTGAMLNFKVFENIEAIKLAVVLSVIAIVGKVAGRGFGAWITAWGRGKAFLFTRENFRMSLQMGIGSIPRTEVALINLMVAIHGGAISPDDVPKFIAATLIFITISVLITPPLLKWAFREEILAQKKLLLENRKEKIESKRRNTR